MESCAQKPTVIITGTGYRTGTDDWGPGSVFTAPGVRINIGAATAHLLLQSGRYNVLMVSRTQRKLARLKHDLLGLGPTGCVTYRAVDMLEVDEVKGLCESLDDDGHY